MECGAGRLREILAMASVQPARVAQVRGI